MLIIGHRGARGLSTENTMASLHKALEHHVDMIEFDLRVTRDNVVVLHHDSGLVDGDKARHRIAETSYEELKGHQPDIVRFEAVLAEFGSKLPLYIEVKSGEPTRPVVDIIKRYGVTKNLRLGSKSQKVLLELQAALPDIATIVIEPWSGVRAHFRAKQLGTKLVSMNQRWLWWGFIRGFKNNGWQLYAYTLNDVAKARRWEKYGLAGVITDYPDLYEKH